MISRQVTTLSLNQIVTALGNVRCSDTLETFAESLAKPIRNVKHCRRGIGFMLDRRIGANHLPKLARMTGDLSE